MITRRAFGIGALAMVASSGDGLVRPLNAPTAGAVAYGVQPGATAGIELARYVVVFGAGGGVFIYNGTPARGNPPVIYETSGTTDPYGNAVNPLTVTVRGTNGSAGISQTGVFLDSAAGAATVLTASGNVAEVSSIGALSSSWLFNLPVLSAAAISAVEPGTTSTAEIWHTVGSLPAGWTALGAGVRYKLLENNTTVRIQVSASIGSTAAAGTVSIFTLGTGYVPVNQFRGCAPGIFTGNTAWATGIVNSRFQVTAGGAVQILGFPGGSTTGVTEIDGQWDVPLDLRGIRGQPMKFNIIHHRRWPRALPHFDVRICPHCGALVFRSAGQLHHEADHEEMWQLLDELRKRTGIAEEQVDGKWMWTAAVGGQDAIEDQAADG